MTFVKSILKMNKIVKCCSYRHQIEVMNEFPICLHPRKKKRKYFFEILIYINI